jgi:thioredoxin-related protein
MWIRRIAVIVTLLAIGFVFLAVSGVTDPSKDEGKEALNWIRYDEGLKLAEKAKKPIFVDFYTNWCRFCKKMDKETFSDKAISQYLGEHFVTVKVNAESKNTVDTPDGSLSERQLARSFSVRGYPTYWFLKPSGEKINYTSGYSPPDKFITVLRYIGDGHYETKSFKDYMAEISAN